MRGSLNGDGTQTGTLLHHIGQDQSPRSGFDFSADIRIPSGGLQPSDVLIHQLRIIGVTDFRLHKGQNCGGDDFPGIILTTDPDLLNLNGGCMKGQEANKSAKSESVHIVSLKGANQNHKSRLHHNPF
jgi:hypothetical protein